jgi:hypothetical protein
MFHDSAPVLARVAAKLFKFFDRGFLRRWSARDRQFVALGYRRNCARPHKGTRRESFPNYA